MAKVIGGPFDDQDLVMPADRLSVSLEHPGGRARYTVHTVKDSHGHEVEVWAPTSWCWKRVQRAYLHRTSR